MKTPAPVARFSTIAFLAIGLAFPFATGAESPALEPAAVLERLRAGNSRYQDGKPTHPNQTTERRTEVAAGQHPIATVLTCSDSRVPVETIFDQGIGDIFVVRVAGNVARTDEIASIEYGAGHLHTSVLLVLGHTNCGAVGAVVKGDNVGGSIPELVSPIVPVAEQTRAANPGLDTAALIEKTVTANVWASVEAVLRTSEEVRELVKKGELQVVGGVYDLVHGAVAVLGTHPQQAALLAAAEREGAREGESVVAEHAATVESRAATATPHAAAASPASGHLGVAPIAIGVLVLAAALFGVYRFSKSGMNHWTVGRRIGAGFTAVLILLGALAAIGYEAMVASDKGFLEFATDAEHTVLTAEIQANYMDMELTVKDYQFTKNPADFQRYSKLREETLPLFAEAKKQFVEPERQKLIAEATAKFDEQFADFKELVGLGKQQGSSSRATAALKDMLADGDAVMERIEQLEEEAIADQNKAEPIIQARFQRTQSILLWLGLAATALGAALAFIIARSITGPMKAIATNLASGADQTSAAAAQVSEASQSLAEGASEQAASLEETSSSLEEITSMTKRNAESAAQTKTIAGQTRAAADSGATDMAEMKQAMDAIKVSSGEIAKIVKTIDEIAFQTNILALNAAVEAARAGEAGAGFAVVAEEVRNLAQRSAVAARETAAKIEDSVSKSEHGVRISGKVAESLQQIVEGARTMDSLVGEIATASQEQTQGIGQVNMAVSQMDKVTQGSASNAEETAAAAEELNAQALSLQESAANLQRMVGGAVTKNVGSTTPKVRPPPATRAANASAAEHAMQGHR
jgi:methyl-accepting chemotaxis protein/carbonic anhydrase